MGKKIYAVRKGKVQGLFYSWEQCRESVEGYPGAEFKGFFTEEEARKYLGMTLASSADAEKTGISNMETERHGMKLLPDMVAAYVDGSFDESIGKYSFGCIFLLPDGKIEKRAGNGDNQESLAIRNVAGEMLGAMYAVRWSIKKGFKRIKICYDYEGIEKWVTGDWKPRNPLTQQYAAYMQRQTQKMGICFTKVAAHTGDLYNEEADQLAKWALTEANGIPEIT